MLGRGSFASQERGPPGASHRGREDQLKGNDSGEAEEPVPPPPDSSPTVVSFDRPRVATTPHSVGNQAPDATATARRGRARELDSL
jgi:hypothetical protein